MRLLRIYQLIILALHILFRNSQKMTFSYKNYLSENVCNLILLSNVCFTNCARYRTLFISEYCLYLFLLFYFQTIQETIKEQRNRMIFIFTSSILYYDYFFKSLFIAENICLINKN